VNPAWGHVAGVVTVVLMVVFLAIWGWAWLPQHRRTFDRLARLPMHDDVEPGTGTGTEDASR
jgi:cytochrome c oxidase cbb3-type subunit 4